jgi:hypothetical protein
MPKPKSTSDVGESYEDTGMAGLAARTAESKYFLYADDGGERERGRRYWQTGGERWRLRFRLQT